jgi:hypothetical protein
MNEERKGFELTHHCLAFSLWSRVGYDIPDIIFKAFVQHPVGLIQYQIINPANSYIQHRVKLTIKSTDRLRSQAPSLTKSKIRPGVPTTILVIFPSLLAFANDFI